jgi:hypothetical protein
VLESLVTNGSKIRLEDMFFRMESILVIEFCRFYRLYFFHKMSLN